ERDGTAAGIVAFEPPLAVSTYSGMRDIGLQVGAQQLVLGVDGKVRIAQRLLRQLETLEGDIGVEIRNPETLLPFARRHQFQIARGAELNGSPHAWAGFLQGVNLVQRQGIAADLKAHPSGFET